MSSLYVRVGEMAFFTRLVANFYEGAAKDPLLRPMYPEDLEGPKERLAAFLAQYFGGPHRYEELRGHPRLRMRHAPFPIDKRARDAWLCCMEAALQKETIAPEDAGALREYFRSTAAFLQNRGGLSLIGR